MVDVLVIGLDGASWELIDRWTSTGDLPTLSSIRDRGVIGELSSVTPPVTVPAWYSYATGMNPGRFGVFDRSMIQVSNSTDSKYADFKERLADSTSVGAPFIWNWLASHDRRATALGVPSMYPAYSCEGADVVAGPAIGGSQWAAPESTRERVESLIDGYGRHGTPDLSQGPTESIEHELERHSERIHTLAQQWLTDEPQPDFLQVVYFSTDMAGHVFWPEHYRSEHGSDKRDRLKDHYQWIDHRVAALLEHVDTETDVILMSDHGMGPIYDRFQLNNWLAREGYLKLSSPNPPLLSQIGLTRERASSILMSLPFGEAIRQLTPRTVKKKISHSDPRVDKLDVDWEQTDAFGLGEVGQIYINNEAEYEAVRDSLIDDLRMFAQEEGIDINIHTKEEVYEGSQQSLESAPDIYFTLQSFEFGVNHGFSGEGELWKQGGNHSDPIGGAHRTSGMFMAAGPSFETKDSKNFDARLIDLVPTILHVMGEPIPHGTDGSVLTDILATDGEPTYERWENQRWTDTYSDNSDSHRRRERLKSLGYLE